MKPVRIIGVGSPFGPDALGLAAAERLRADGLTKDYPYGWVSVEVCDRCGVGLLEEIRDAGLAILIDAASFGATPGHIRRFGERDIECTESVTSSHGLGVAEVLALSRSLDALPPKLILYGIEIGQAPASDGIFEIPEREITELRNAIKADISAYVGL